MRVEEEAAEYHRRPEHHQRHVKPHVPLRADVSPKQLSTRRHSQITNRVIKPIATRPLERYISLYNQKLHAQDPHPRPSFEFIHFQHTFSVQLFAGFT